MGTKIAEVRSIIYEEEVDALSGISEDTWFKIGAAINFVK